MGVRGDQSQPSHFRQLNKDVLTLQVSVRDAKLPQVGEKIEKRQDEVPQNSLLELIIVRQVA